MKMTEVKVEGDSSENSFQRSPSSKKAELVKIESL